MFSETQRYLQTIAAIAPPINGPTINTQTFKSDSPPSKRAGPKERAGFTLVPVKYIPSKCTRVKAPPITRPATFEFSILL